MVSFPVNGRRMLPASWCSGQCALASLVAESIAAAGGTRHAEYPVDHGVFVVAAARDGLHGHGVEAALLDVALVEMNADHAPEHEAPAGVLAVEVHQLDLLRHAALQRRRRGLDARRAHEPRRRSLEAGMREFAFAARQRRGG